MSSTTDHYTQPRASQMATRTLLTSTSPPATSGDTSSSPTAAPTLHRRPTNNYEEARAAANQSLMADTTGPSSPNATKADLKRSVHEQMLGSANVGGGGYFSTSAGSS